MRSTLISKQKSIYKFLHPEWTHYTRNIEIDFLLEYLKPGQKILEIGSGDGYVAHYLSSKHQLNVTASDIEPRLPQYTDVLNTKDIKSFQNNYYDVIISIHVLEHVNDIDSLLKDNMKYLKKDGVMLHIMPSTINMFVTSLVQPLAYIRSIYLILNGYHLSRFTPFQKKNIFRFLKFCFKTLNPYNIVWGSGHGIHNRWNCFRYWNLKSWVSIFHRNKLVVEKTFSSPFLYSMHKIFPFIGTSIRRKMARIGFSSSSLFILRKQD
jgi:ubiquinone/menaquinone biosynthesis C-methylase UbiE